MNPATWWPAPAKLNLFLHVVGREPDGYHRLQTLFQLLDYGDAIRLAVREDGVIERLEGPVAIEPEDDLCVRAARLLQRHSGTTLGVDIRLIKRIPVGAGLGGGSSDAATVLLVLNALWATGLNLQQLAALGLELGADVPLFVHGSSAWGEGRGEQLAALALPPRWYLIIYPEVAVSTAEIFQAPELTRNSPLITIRDFSRTGARNDCEDIVRARYPEVDAALRWLSTYAGARMTGTGSSVFAGFDTSAEAACVAARVPDKWTSVVARGVNRSPLHELLAPGTTLI